MVIDVHAHYIPREISHGIYSDLFNMETRDHECFMIVGGHEIELADKGLVDSEKLLKDMDQAGIDMCFISPPPFCFYYEHSKCPDWTRAFNSSMSEDLSKNAPRFRYLATLPLCDMMSTLEELDTVLQDPLCAGVEIATNVAGIELDDMSLHPFWRIAGETGLFVLIHPHYTVRTARFDRYHLRNLIGNPLDTALAAFALMTGDIVGRFPGVKICLSHAGGYTPYAIARFEHARQVRKEFASVDTPYEKRCRDLYYDTVLHDPETLSFVADKISVSHLLLGSDYPFDMGDNDPVQTVKAIGLGEDEQEAILSGNIKRLFGTL